MYLLFINLYFILKYNRSDDKKNTIGVKLNFVIELFYFGLIDQTKLSPMCPESNCSKQKQKQKLLKEHTEKSKNRIGQEKKK